ncbi:DinB family protein [Arundinibacter roseus]|uniref:DinB family protein n=1 Tax=Arundinibacter roseus TaxID=2070510 RepID=UPI001E53C510|nr:DinB family protein [Arundinibacter roseus]
MISFIETFQRELADESKETRRMLAIVPADKMDWQPHPKSMTLKALATHLAEIPIMITVALEQDKWDFAEEPYNPYDFPTAEALLARFDECIEKAENALAHASDDNLRDNWKLCSGEQVFMEVERWEAVRHAFGQNAHHRAQLGVFLRLLDIPIPGPYGPSADEMALYEM